SLYEHLGVFLGRDEHLGACQGNPRGGPGFAGRCHRPVYTPFTIGPSRSTSILSSFWARRSVAPEVPFSFAAPAASVEPIGPLLKRSLRKPLASSIALGDLFSDAACSASVAVISTGSGCHMMNGARIGAPVCGSVPTSRSEMPKASVFCSRGAMLFLPLTNSLRKLSSSLITA